MKLTRAALAKVQFPAGKSELLLFDDDLSGFGLRLHPSGRGTWFAQFRIGKQQRRLSLGTRSTVHPDEARRLARDALAKAQLGQDPQAERAKSKVKAQASYTLGSLAEAYLQRHAAPRLKPRSFLEVERHLRTAWAPLAGTDVNGVRRADVAARLAALAKDNGPFAANRARAALSALFSWAMGEGLAEANPVAGTNRPAEEVARDRVLSDSELALAWTLAGPGDFGAIVHLLILTAARREEVAAMRWDELEGPLWRIPRERTKNGRPHELCLPRGALDVLEGHPRQEGRDLVFGSRTGPFSGFSKAKRDLDARMLVALREMRGPKANLTPWRLHDLRRTTATGMAGIGVAPHVVEAVLNHVSGHKAGVAGVYNRATYTAEKREALQRWADHVNGLAGGGDGVR